MMKYEETWLGLGFKVGGIWVVYGYESNSGRLFNLHNPVNSHRFAIKSHRVGLGLGGGFDSTAVCIFNTKNIHKLDGLSIDDWGLNIDIAKGRLKDAAKLLKFEKAVKSIRLASLMYNITGNLSEIRDAMAFIYNLYEVASSKGPAVHSIDIPLSGAGVEASLFRTVGKMSID
jgi:hypothetical protein